MKKIYIVLTHTGTLLSRLIKYYTKDEFSHVSICLDKELEEMYSFGRLNPYNPFWGGFVHERIDQGTFKRFFRTISKIYSLEVTDEQYEKIRNIIEKMKFNNDINAYKFNFIGLLAVGIHKKIRTLHGFYCAEFVKYILENSGVETNLPEIVKPEDFKNMQGIYEEYSGLLNYYSKRVYGVS